MVVNVGLECPAGCAIQFADVKFNFSMLVVNWVVELDNIQNIYKERTGLKPPYPVLLWSVNMATGFKVRLLAFLSVIVVHQDLIYSTN